MVNSRSNHQERASAPMRAAELSPRITSSLLSCTLARVQLVLGDALGLELAQLVEHDLDRLVRLLRRRASVEEPAPKMPLGAKIEATE